MSTPLVSPVILGEEIADETTPILEQLEREPMAPRQNCAADLLFGFVADSLPTGATGVTLTLVVTDADDNTEEILLNAGDEVDSVGGVATAFTCTLLMAKGLTYDLKVNLPGTLTYLQVDEVD